jgi:hypothetical protein
MAGHEQEMDLPDSWCEQSGELYCLGCRRDLAAESGVLAVGEDATRERTAKARASALVDFEIQRDPERSNGEIARAIRASVSAVAKGRERLGVEQPS